MNEMELIKSSNFESVQCDFYGDGNDYFMTRKQIGEALEYSDPQKAIDKIHAKHKVRLDKYSVTTTLVGTDKKTYDTIVYPRKGIMEICRWSQQPKADSFMDWAWNVLDDIMNGKTKIVRRDSYAIEDPIERAQAWIKEEEERKALKSQNTEQQKQISSLNTENSLLASENLKWADRKFINAAVRKFGWVAYKGDFARAWDDYKKELLYKHSINLNCRITKYLNETGKATRPATLNMLDDSELSNAVSTIVSLCKEHKVDISELINKVKEIA